MLHLNIQKGEEAMKTYKFQHHTEGTSAYMKIQIMIKKGVTNCCQMTPNLLISSSVV